MSNYTDSDNGKAPTVWRRGAHDGIYIGVWMSAIFVFSIYSQGAPLLSLMTLIMMAAVPAIVYRRLKRDWQRWPNVRFFSSAWLQGICMFFFGSLIMAAVMVVFLKFIQPDLIHDSVQQAIAFYQTLNDPQSAEMARTLQTMINQHLLPTAINVAFSMIWLATFTGSILSMILSGIVKITTR